MRRVLMSTLWVRAAVSIILAALIVAVITALVVFGERNEWRQALARYDTYYAGGGQARCEKLISDFMKSRSRPACEIRVETLRYTNTPNEQLANTNRMFQKYKDCELAQAADDAKYVQTLLSSGCPIDTVSWTLDQTNAPHLNPPEAPGSLWAFTSRKGLIKVEDVAILFPLLAIFFLLCTVVTRAIYLEPHIGWKRLTIVLSLLLAPMTPLLYAHDNDLKAVEIGFLLSLGLLGSAALLVTARKTIIWIQSGFSKQGVAPLAQKLNAQSSYGETTEQSAAARHEITDISKNNVSDGVSKEDDLLESARQTVLGMPLASPWRRFFARTIDFTLLSFPLAFVCGILFGELVIEHPFFYGLVTLPILIALEALILTTFGNSPGKALLAIRLTTLRGSRPSFNDYCARGFYLYIYGIAFGIPFVSLFPMIKQYQNLNAGRPASYDAGKFSVRVSDLGTARKVLAGITLFTLGFIPGCLSVTLR